MFGLPCCSAGQFKATACACFWSVRHSSSVPPNILQHSAGVGMSGLRQIGEYPSYKPPALQACLIKQSWIQTQKQKFESMLSMSSGS